MVGFAEGGDRVEQAVAAVLHRDVGQCVERHVVLVQVAHGAHGVQRRHDHAAPVVPVVAAQRQRAAAQAAQLVHAEHHYGVVLAGLERRQRGIEGGGAAGAGVVDVVHRAAGGVQFAQRALAGQRGADGVAAVKGLHILGGDARIVQCLENRVLRQRLFGQIRETAEVGDADANDLGFAHLLTPVTASKA